MSLVPSTSGVSQHCSTPVGLAGRIGRNQAATSRHRRCSQASAIIRHQALRPIRLGYSTGRTIGVTPYASDDFSRSTGMDVASKPAGTRQASSSYLSEAKDTGSGVFALLVVNLLIFALDHLLHMPGIQSLYLYHMRPHWWQFITCCFCHGDWGHLSGNLFSLYVFGRIVEEEGGVFGVWLTYLVCGVGGAVASYLSQPGGNAVSLGASGAIFGLFAVGVLCKLSPNPRKLVEAFVLGQFVVKQLLQEVTAQAAVMSGRGLSQVSHVAHLGGALVGVLLVLLLSRLPDNPE